MCLKSEKKYAHLSNFKNRNMHLRVWQYFFFIKSARGPPVKAHTTNCD